MLVTAQRPASWHILAALAKPPGLFEDLNPSSRLPEAPGRLGWLRFIGPEFLGRCGMFCSKVHKKQWMDVVES